MKIGIVAFISGVIFALGLTLGRMTQPHVVIGFLDVFGDWNPTLLFVIGGAVGVHALAYQWIRKRRSPIFEARFYLPGKSELEPRLFGGAAIFGVGWGLAGYCPGPAVTSLVSGSPRVLVFVVAMAAGMWLYEAVSTRIQQRQAVPAGAESR